jgi:hypothetical protein
MAERNISTNLERLSAAWRGSRAPGRRIGRRNHGALARLLDEALTRATDEEFAPIVRPYSPRARNVTVDMRAHGMRMKVRAWTEEVKHARLCGIVDDGIRAGLRADVASLAKALGALAQSS